MFNNTTKTQPKSKGTAKSGLVQVTLQAINPSAELYKTITGRDFGSTTDYSVKEGKAPLRLLVSVDNNFLFIDMWDLQNRINTSKTGKTQFIDSTNGKTTWRATKAEAISDLGEDCKEAKVGEETVVNIMLQFRGPILNHIIDNAAQFEQEVYEGNWSMFNNLMQLHKIDKKFFSFIYTRTSDSGYPNLQAMRNIFTPTWKVLDKENNVKEWTTKEGDKMSEVIRILNSVRESMDKSEYLQKPNIFISLQLGFVEEGGETPIVSNFEIPEADADKTDDLPF